MDVQDIQMQQIRELMNQHNHHEGLMIGLFNNDMNDISDSELDPPTPAYSSLMGIPTSLLYNGSRFQGHQKSKGNRYDVEVVLQVGGYFILNYLTYLKYLSF